MMAEIEARSQGPTGLYRVLHGTQDFSMSRDTII